MTPSQGLHAPSQELEDEHRPRPPTLLKNGSAAASEQGRSKRRAIPYALLAAAIVGYSVIAWRAGWLP